MAKENESTAILNVMALNEDTSEALRGKRVSFTGHLGMTRADMVKFIQDHGGVYDETPKWGTTYLVTNREWNKGSTATEKAGSSKPKSKKLIEAEKNGVKIISEKDLVEMVWKYQEANPQQKASGE